MQDRTRFIAQARAFERAVGQASESLRGDPALKARFDAETKPMRETLDGQIKRFEVERTYGAATEARVRETQAREGADDLRRAAVARGDMPVDDRRSERELRSRARDAGSDARQTEQQLRTLGVTSVDDIKRRADSAVAPDDQRVTDSTRNSDINDRGPHDRGGRRRGG